MEQIEHDLEDLAAELQQCLQSDPDHPAADQARRLLARYRAATRGCAGEGKPGDEPSARAGREGSSAKKQGKERGV